VYTLPCCHFSQELWDTPIGTHVLHMRASNLHCEHSFRRAYYASSIVQKIATVRLLLVKLFKCLGTKNDMFCRSTPVAHPAFRPKGPDPHRLLTSKPLQAKANPPRQDRPSHDLWLQRYRLPYRQRITACTHISAGCRLKTAIKVQTQNRNKSISIANSSP